VICDHVSPYSVCGGGVHVKPLQVRSTGMHVLGFVKMRESLQTRTFDRTSN
jgi:hypothetical protein